MARSAESYKQLSIREYTKAAKNYESGKAGIYKMKPKWRLPMTTFSPSIRLAMPWATI